MVYERLAHFFPNLPARMASPKSQASSPEPSLLGCQDRLTKRPKTGESLMRSESQTKETTDLLAWDVPLDLEDKCSLCTVPWTTDEHESFERWMASHDQIFSVTLETLPIQATSFEAHHSGCFALPLPGSWITLEALKFMAIHSLSHPESLVSSPHTIPLVKVEEVSRKGIYCTLKPTICFFVPSSLGFVLTPGAFVEHKLPVLAIPASSKTVTSTQTFDLPSTLDHKNLQVFQRALLDQTLAMTQRKTFLMRSFDRRPVDHSLTPSTSIEESLLTLSPHLMVRASKRADFCEWLVEETVNAKDPEALRPWWPGGILHSKTGSGKTVMGSRLVNHWWSILGSQEAAKPILIIAPTNMYSTWKDHLSLWSDLPRDKLFFCGGGHHTPSQDVFNSPCVIVISKALWCRKRNLHSCLFSYLLIDEVHVQMPPRRSFPLLAPEGAAIGLTATIVDDADHMLLSNLRILRQTYPHNALLFRSLTSKRIEATVFDGVATLNRGRYTDTRQPFISIPRVAYESIHAPPSESDTKTCQVYLEHACRAIMKRYNFSTLASMTQGSIEAKNLAPGLYGRLYLDLQRLYAGDLKVIDPSFVIIPPGSNLSTNPFVRLLKFQEDLALEDGVTCAICRDTELTDPVTLGCKHSFCMGCIQTWFNGPRTNGRKCPTCRKAIRTGHTSDGSVFHEDPKVKPEKMAFCGEGRERGLTTYLAKTFSSLSPSESRPKLVIGVRFPRVVRVVESLVKKANPDLKVKAVSASQDPERRASILEEFSKEDSDLSVLVIQYSVAGVGINLTSASHLLLYDHFLPHEATQLKGRLLRMGQKNDTISVTTLDSLPFQKSYPQRKATVLYELEKAAQALSLATEPLPEPSMVSVTVHTAILIE